MTGSCFVGPFLSQILLPEQQLYAASIHQHPVTSGGVQVRSGVQVVAVSAKTSHKREQEPGLVMVTWARKDTTKI